MKCLQKLNSAPFLKQWHTGQPACIDEWRCVEFGYPLSMGIRSFSIRCRRRLAASSRPPRRLGRSERPGMWRNRSGSLWYESCKRLSKRTIRVGAGSFLLRQKSVGFWRCGWINSWEVIISLRNTSISVHIGEGGFRANCKGFLKNFRHGILLSW